MQTNSVWCHLRWLPYVCQTISNWQLSVQGAASESVAGLSCQDLLTTVGFESAIPKTRVYLVTTRSPARAPPLSPVRRWRSEVVNSTPMPTVQNQQPMSSMRYESTWTTGAEVLSYDWCWLEKMTLNALWVGRNRKMSDDVIQTAMLLQSRKSNHVLSECLVVFNCASIPIRSLAAGCGRKITRGQWKVGFLIDVNFGSRSI